MGAKYGSEEWIEEQRIKRIEALKRKKEKSSKAVAREQKKREEKIVEFYDEMAPVKQIRTFEVMHIEQDEIISAVENLQIMTLQKFPTLIRKCDDLRALSYALNSINSTLESLKEKKDKLPELPPKSIYEDVVEKIMKLKAKQEKQNGKAN